jgi:penicillin-binding protein 1A
MMKASVLPADAAQQYFPTYRIPADKIEVALKEYDLSAQALTADQRSISLATGLAVLGISFSGTLLGSDNGLRALKSALEEVGHIGELGLAALVIAIALVVVRYFAELQRNATYAARKIVVLRRLLGVDYGTQERVFPTDRIEGANEPFAIAMFPGWGSIGPLASAIVAVFAGAVLAILFSTLAQQEGSLASAASKRVGDATYLLPTIAAFAAGLLLTIYRAWLLESWETKRFLAGKAVANELSVTLKERMGHVLYRLELSVYEAKRVGIYLDGFLPILLHIEDRRFFRHNGNDWRAFARALLLRWKYGFTSGGSTIDQQLFRSNCLARLDRTWRRKPVEWMMGPWIRSRFGPDQVWRMYLCSVRFDRGVIGLPAALVHFFDVDLRSGLGWVPTRAQVFFLVERLSNISRNIPTRRIRSRLNGLREASLISDEDIAELREIYLDQIGKGLITGNVDDIEFGP